MVHEGNIGVSAMGKDVEVQAGEGTSVKKGMPPEPPKKLLPPPAPVDLQPQYVTMPVIVKISPVEGAHRYSAALTRDREGRDIAVEKVLAPGEAFQIPGLEERAYYLHLRSIDEQGLEGLEGEPSMVRVLPEQQPPERSIVGAIVTIILVIAAMLL